MRIVETTRSPAAGQYLPGCTAAQFSASEWFRSRFWPRACPSQPQRHSSSAIRTTTDRRSVGDWSKRPVQCCRTRRDDRGRAQGSGAVLRYTCRRLAHRANQPCAIVPRCITASRSRKSESDEEKETRVRRSDRSGACYAAPTAPTALDYRTFNQRLRLRRPGVTACAPVAAPGP